MMKKLKKTLLQKRLMFIVLNLSVIYLLVGNYANATVAQPGFKPYFASIKSNQVNVRVGPNIRYPIQWVFVRKNEPVEVIADFEHWRKIRDIYGDEGWIKSNMIHNHRHIIIVGQQTINLYKKPTPSSSIIAKIQPETRGVLLSCKNNMCQAEFNKIKGWVEQKNLWGIYKEEIIK